jgi:hypothetical protein
MDNDFYTDAEVSFIKTLGSHSKSGRTASRKDLLSGYIDGCEQRQVWDELDRVRIMRVAINELQLCGGIVGVDDQKEVIERDCNMSRTIPEENSI